MSYTALYRKFRPQTFADVKGQDHIVTTLRNQINADRLSHAYIFCGTRGTGKTTIAKILARTVNCENPTPDGACGECDSCKAIKEGRSLNVVEIDAASNNGVESVRTIIDEISTPPDRAKYRVYIIDEVHMLSVGAFNALLKTIEEPPEYALFILATTDIHKVPITILSRCQRYDFKRIDIETITSRLKELTEIESLSCDDKALKYIAKMADGSMRDALSLLDQCVAFNFGDTLTYDKALDILGAVDTSVFSSLLRNCMADEVVASLNLVETVVLQGRELSQFVTDFIWYLRNIMLVKACGDESAIEALEVSSAGLTLLKEEAEQLEFTTIYRYINVFSDLSNRMKYSAQKRIMLEMAIIKLCRPQMETDVDSVLERVRVLEKKLEEGITVTPAVLPVENTRPHLNVDRVPLPAAVPEDIKKIVREWEIIKGKSSELTRILLSKITVDMLTVSEDGYLVFGITDTIQKMQLSDPEKRKEVEQLLSEHVGSQVHYRLEEVADKQEFSDRFETLQSFINMPIKKE